MTRFLQAMFGAERSAFLLVLRHPFGAAHHLWNAGTGFTADCGARFIVHWLKIHQALLDDAKFLKSITVVQYEHFMQGDTQGVFNSVEAQLGLSPSVSLVAVDTSDANNAVQKPWIQRRHRRLLELHGSRSNITVIKGSEFQWEESFNTYAAANDRMCQEVFEKYEARVNAFGYSLFTPRTVWRPEVFRRWYVRHDESGPDV